MHAITCLIKIQNLNLVVHMIAKPKRYLWTEMFMKNIRHQCQSCPLPPPSPPPDQLFSLPKSSRGATTTTPLSHIRPFFWIWSTCCGRNPSNLCCSKNCIGISWLFDNIAGIPIRREYPNDLAGDIFFYGNEGYFDRKLKTWGIYSCL